MLTATGLHENRPMRDLTKERMKAYKNALLNGTAPRGLKGRAVKAPTIAKKLGLIKAWLEWATNNDYLDKNPMKGLELPAKLVASQKQKKAAFSDAELQTILKALAPERTSENLMRQEWHWVVVCLMFTGARLSEIVQLLPADVRQIDGVWCFVLEGGEGKQLKNAPSQRVVPMHSQLVAMGFLDWHRQQTSPRLFPLLWDKGAAKVSHFFSYLLKVQKLKTPAISLHSYRHTMAIRLEQARTHYSIMRRLLGHSIGSDVESRVYLGSLEYPVKELSEALENVSFPRLPADEQSISS